MRIITFSADIDKILEHIGVDSQAPRITPARGPPLWDDCAAQKPGEGVDAMPDWDMTSQSAPDYPGSYWGQTPISLRCIAPRPPGEP